MEEVEVLYCHVMYITVDLEPEAAPQQERTVDLKDLRKAVSHLVWEFESRGEFSPKARRAWSGHPAAPMLVVAGRNTVSTSGSEKRHTHRVCSDHTWGRRGSIGRAKWIFGHNPRSLEIRMLEGIKNRRLNQLTQGRTASISS
jgi:hypothetical protein